VSAVVKKILKRIVQSSGVYLNSRPDFFLLFLLTGGFIDRRDVALCIITPGALLDAFPSLTVEARKPPEARRKRSLPVRSP